MVPLSILHIVNSLGAGGAERFAFDLAAEQARNGHQVTVIGLSDPHDLGDKSGINDTRVAALAEIGVAHHVLGHGHRRRVITGAGPLRRILRSAAPNLVHSHLLVALAILRASGYQVPVVATHHNTELPTSRVLFRAISSRASAFVAISEPALEILRSVYRGPLELIYNGIGGKALPPVQSEPEAPLRLLSLGQMKPAKNYSHLIDVAEAARTRGVHAAFRIAGDGAERNMIEQKIATLGLEDRVQLLGGRKDVAELLATTDVYLMTSRQEGMPIALIEALQAGLPVLATDVGGCGEVVGRDERAGYLLKPGDTAGFADRIAMLATDQNLRARMGLAARERARQFTIATTAKAYEALYRKVLA
ncbi:MAG: glycosyltransferase [Pseudomonadota bacterium]